MTTAIGQNGLSFHVPSLAASDISNQQQLANAYVERLIGLINEFDRRLDHEHQVALRLVSFGQMMTLNVQNIASLNPGLVIFYGTQEDGSPLELIQHVSQISFMLMAVKRENPAEPKQPIGFLAEPHTQNPVA